MAACARCGSVSGDPLARFCSRCGTAIGGDRSRAGPAVDLGWGTAVLGEPIGEGGMGIVRAAWLYHDPRGPRAGAPARPVAVKLLHPSLRSKPRARELFEREAAVMAQLSHPNLVELIAFTEWEGQLAIVMELVDGQPLGRVIARHAARAKPGELPCLPFARAWHYFSQLLGALAALHALGLVHRDVKPGNVLVRRDGLVKLTDFGIVAVAGGEPGGTAALTPGTAAYMAPEQVLGGPLDARADLYAAALVLYEMLTGASPFDTANRDDLAVRTAQLHVVPPPLSRRLAGAPPALDRLVAHALAKRSEERFASAVELGEAFRVALGLPGTDGWVAQQALAAGAAELVRAGEAGRGREPKLEPIRTLILEAYERPRS